MKGYVVTVLQIPQSVEVAERCVVSGAKFGVDVEMCPAVYKADALSEMEIEGLKVEAHDTSYSHPDAVIANFLSQYRIWFRIVEANQPAIVLEHDAVFVASVPKLTGDIINLGKPSYGRFNTKSTPGVYPLFSKNAVAPYGAYMPGAHGYYLTPAGATQLIAKAQHKGIAPCDIFLCTANFPNIKELYPWVVEAHDSFTTIQKEKGCQAKHNFKKGYKIL